MDSLIAAVPEGEDRKKYVRVENYTIHINLYCNKKYESITGHCTYGLKQISGILQNERFGVVEWLQTFDLSSNLKAVSLLLEKPFSILLSELKFDLWQISLKLRKRAKVRLLAVYYYISIETSS